MQIIVTQIIRKPFYTTMVNVNFILAMKKTIIRKVTIKITIGKSPKFSVTTKKIVRRKVTTRIIIKKLEVPSTFKNKTYESLYF